MLKGEKRKMQKIQIGEMLTLSKENLEWFNKNYDCLKKEYDNQWIAVLKKEVVAKASTYDQIMSVLNKKDLKNALIEFIDSQQIAMFF